MFRSTWKITFILLLVFAVGCGSAPPEAPQPTDTPEDSPAVEILEPEPTPTAVPDTPTPVPTTDDTDEPIEDPISPLDTPTLEVAPQSEPISPVDTPTPEASLPEPGAGDAHVTFVKASQNGSGLWSFTVTVTHPDTGWEDYADGWDVVLPDGTIVKANESDTFTRLLLHPHETEQPFTRSQSNLSIPPEVTTVTVRANDLVDGWGGQEVVVDLTEVSGPEFEVSR